MRNLKRKVMVGVIMSVMTLAVIGGVAKSKVAIDPPIAQFAIDPPIQQVAIDPPAPLRF